MTSKIDTVTKYKDKNTFLLTHLRDIETGLVLTQPVGYITSDMMHWNHFFHLALNNSNSRKVSKKIEHCLVKW